MVSSFSLDLGDSKPAYNKLEVIPVAKSETTNHLERYGLPKVANELLDHTIDVLRTELRFLTSHSVFQFVQSAKELKLQEFFNEGDLQFSRGELVKPVFFSVQQRQIVISHPDLEAYLSRYSNAWVEDKTSVYRAVELFAKNRIEFAIHEYGHILSINNFIRITEPDKLAALKEQRARIEAIVVNMPHTELSRQRMIHALSDLKAEVLRRDIHFDHETNRRPELFSQDGVADRVLPSGSFRDQHLYHDSIFRMLFWYPICKCFGPVGYEQVVLNVVSDVCKEVDGRLFVLAELVKNYYTNYFDWRSFDTSKLGKV